MKPFPWLHCGAQDSPCPNLGQSAGENSISPKMRTKENWRNSSWQQPSIFSETISIQNCKNGQIYLTIFRWNWRPIKGLLLFPNKYYPVFVKLLLFQHHAGLQSASIRLAYTVITILSFTWKGFFHHRCCPDHHHHPAIDIDCCNICSVLIPRWCPREVHKPVLRFSSPCSRHIWHSRNSPRDDYGWLHTGYRVFF